MCFSQNFPCGTLTWEKSVIVSVLNVVKMFSASSISASLLFRCAFWVHPLSKFNSGETFLEFVWWNKNRIARWRSHDVQLCKVKKSYIRVIISQGCTVITLWCTVMRATLNSRPARCFGLIRWLRLVSIESSWILYFQTSDKTGNTGVSLRCDFLVRFRFPYHKNCACVLGQVHRIFHGNWHYFLLKGFFNLCFTFT